LDRGEKLRKQLCFSKLQLPKIVTNNLEKKEHVFQMMVGIPESRTGSFEYLEQALVVTGKQCYRY